MRINFVALLFVAFLIAAVYVTEINASVIKKVRYDGYQVFKLKINNKWALKAINSLEKHTSKYNIWKDYDDRSKELHIMVKPAELGNFAKLLKAHKIEQELMIPNVQELIDAETLTQTENSSRSESFGWTRYYSLAKIEAWLDEILANYSKVAEGFEIGKSFEGRTIRGIKISHKAGNPGIFIESNIHAREWITSASATWFINELLSSTKPEVRELAENYDWYIIPVFNVDGFVYSHERDRMWRKTRQPVAHSPCVGTDGNRNFDSHWMENGGACGDPCCETYAGPKPFSEPETKALADYVNKTKDKLNIYISFHSYGQYLLSPYGHNKTEFPENYEDLQAISKEFVTAIDELQYKTKYTYGSTAEHLYVASGTSVDWVFTELDIKVGFTIEYRDKGHYGFVLPPVYIIPNCEELMAGMQALVKKSKELGYI